MLLEPSPLQAGWQGWRVGRWPYPWTVSRIATKSVQVDHFIAHMQIAEIRESFFWNVNSEKGFPVNFIPLSFTFFFKDNNVPDPVYQYKFGGHKSLGPPEKSLEMPDYVFCPHKKLTSRMIRNRGAKIVIFLPFFRSEVNTPYCEDSSE